MEKVRVFVIDPAWRQQKGGLRKSRGNQGRKLDYVTMEVPEIFGLLDREIFLLAENDHCVFMWTIDRFLLECENEMEKRGYKRHCRMIWNKLNGVAPAFTVRYSHEYLIWFYRKPDFCYRMIDALYPSCGKMDVFSRERRHGWRQFGNQTDYFN